MIILLHFYLRNFHKNRFIICISIIKKSWLKFIESACLEENIVLTFLLSFTFSPLLTITKIDFECLMACNLKNSTNPEVMKQ
ncbi:hypothetical protein A0H76_2452 [Hepatospora eriocheir]|uniref:Uncharacterized protein n=1 Tax=Hepatospora eriocheir TaxID=1081669 RepID=A0A1X0QFB1_9MICR|nr:hypothetical protein A0H76_2452 [Hepatospora eriocheir]